jgi:hypothetical protein
LLAYERWKGTDDMKAIRQAVRLVLACLAISASVEAHAAIRFIATTGLDTNVCTRTAPCRTLQKAHDVAAAGDEIQILNSGEFGGAVLTITKSVTISGVGVSATISSPGSTAILIDNAAAKVVLRNLLLFSSGSGGGSGIVVSEASAVHVEHCEIERFGSGIVLVADNSELFVAGSAIRDTSTGILASATGARLTVDDSLLENNKTGMLLDGIRSTVTRTTISGGSDEGILQSGGQLSLSRTTMAGNDNGYLAGPGTVAAFEHCVVRDNASTGITADTLRISDCVVTNNGTGLINGDTTLTRGNNTISGNGTDLVGDPLTPLPGT